MKTYTEEEVKNIVELALFAVDDLITTSGQIDGFVDINFNAVEAFYQKHLKDYTSPDYSKQQMPNFDDDFEHIDTKIVNGQEIKTPSLFAVPKRPTKGIAVDCGAISGKNPGTFEYRGIDIETGECVFRYTIPGESTNNIAEWLAIINGIAYLVENNRTDAIYSDSLTAIAWWRKKSCKTKYAVTDKTQLNDISLGCKMLALNPKIKVHFWDNNLYGEIPADLSGRKGIKK